jgi:hypothetical protein
MKTMLRVPEQAVLIRCLQVRALAGPPPLHKFQGLMGLGPRNRNPLVWDITWYSRGTDLLVNSQAKLNAVVRQLHERPRKTLDLQPETKQNLSEIHTNITRRI